jgi:magnesium chelatase family protein
LVRRERPLMLKKSLETARIHSPADKAVLKQALTDQGLSARAHNEILRLTRIIADLAAHENISADDVCEAVKYRGLDRKT